MKLYVYPDGWHLTYDDGRGANGGENTSMSGCEMSDVYAKQLQQCFADDYNEPCKLIYIEDEPEPVSEFAIIRS